MVSANAKQRYRTDPVAVRETDQYQNEYIEQFVRRWDELIDWEARAESEGDFFIRELRKRGVRRVLDVATGTGFHSIRLMEAGFDVTSADGNPEMLAMAFENGRERGHILRTVQADWRWLSRDVHERFDAITCLGNSFTHLHSENDRRKALAEFYACLNFDGVLILDQRNYDAMLDNGYSSNGDYYYCGEDVDVRPEHLDPGLARFRYEFPGGEIYYLNMFPLRRAYSRKLMQEVGFQRIHTYGDFERTVTGDEPDFFIHVAEKMSSTSAAAEDAPVRSTPSTVVSVSKEYYDSSAADRFYHAIWGGEDIHIGVYESEGEDIAVASRRTVERMATLLPPIESGMRIADLGAGYGGAARQLARRYGCEVVCLNLSEVQNRRNRELNREQGLASLVEVVDGNFEDVPFPGEDFDIVWSQDAFLHSGDRDLTIRECARILKPGGTLIFTDPMQNGHCDVERLKPVLDRIHLDSMGSLHFYRDAALRHGLREVRVVEMTEQLVTHYTRVRQEIDLREDELVEMCGRDYVEKMRSGLGHWIANGEDGNLRWAVLVFSKK